MADLLPKNMLANLLRNYLSFVRDAFLLALGLANCYPLLWMIGTSLKSQTECLGHRSEWLPRTKYLLSETGRNRLLDGLNSGQRAFILAAREADERQQRNNSIAVRTRYTVDEYATLFCTAAMGSAAGDRIRKAQGELDELVVQRVVVHERIQWDHFRRLWSSHNTQFFLHFATSAVLAFAVVFLVVLITSMCGWALGMFAFPGRGALIFLILLAMVAPQEAVVLPVFRLLRLLGALDGLLGLALWLSTLSIGSALLFAACFKSLPREMVEAARIDGAGHWTIYSRIALPLVRPIVTVVALFAFLGAWNNLLLPLAYTISRPNLQPLAVAIYRFQMGYEGIWNEINAAASVMIVPILILFACFQRYLITSMVAGGVKG